MIAQGKGGRSLLRRAAALHQRVFFVDVGKGGIEEGGEIEVIAGEGGAGEEFEDGWVVWHCVRVLRPKSQHT